MTDPARNKQVVQGFLRTAFVAGKPEEAVAKYVGAVYRQHSPTAADGKDAFIAFASRLAREHPDLRLDVKRLIAEGDLVAVHMHVTGLHAPGEGAEDGGHAVVDIFRLDGDGRIVEHWDVMQPMPPDSPNANGMF
jgi:predicted SnoaL-like aldol condensation-catalyzing enzyme